MNCRVYRKLEFNSDHRPVIATCRIKLKKQSFASQPNSRFDVSKLRISEVEYQYQVAIQNRFMALADGTGKWDTFKDAHTKVAEEVVGFRRYVRHEWISDRTRNFVEKKRTARLNHDMDQYKDLNRQCKKLARQDKQNWAESKVKFIWLLARLKMPLHAVEISELLAHGKSRLFSTIMATL